MTALFLGIAVAFFATGSILITISLRRGRAVVNELRTRHQTIWQAMGCPRPTLFFTPQSLRFNEFILQRQYEKLGDSSLARQCRALRQYELAVLIYLLAGFALLGLGAVYVRLPVSG